MGLRSAREIAMKGVVRHGFDLRGRGGFSREFRAPRPRDDEEPGLSLLDEAVLALNLLEGGEPSRAVTDPNGAEDEGGDPGESGSSGDGVDPGGDRDHDGLVSLGPLVWPMVWPSVVGTNNAL